MIFIEIFNILGQKVFSIDNVEINKFSDLSGYLKTKSPNDVVNAEILRGNNLKNIAIIFMVFSMNSHF